MGFQTWALPCSITQNHENVEYMVELLYAQYFRNFERSYYSYVLRFCIHLWYLGPSYIFLS
jgi:hypothetical protein